MIALGLDPAKGVCHVFYRTGAGEGKKTVPLGPEQVMVLSILKGMLGLV